MWIRLIALAAVLLLLAAAWLGGLFDALDQARMHEMLTESGPWGPAAYVLAFALIEPLGAPGILFIVPASFVWPLWLAFALSWIGSVAAGIVGFSFARWIGREWVARRLPDRFHRFDRRLAEHGLGTVILVRLVFFLAPPAHWVLGISSVSFPTFVLGSAIGFAPGIALLTFAGPGLIELWNSVEYPGLWIGGLLILFAVTHRWIRRYQSRESRS